MPPPNRQHIDISLSLVSHCPLHRSEFWVYTAMLKSNVGVNILSLIELPICGAPSSLPAHHKVSSIGPNTQDNWHRIARVLESWYSPFLLQLQYSSANPDHDSWLATEERRRQDNICCCANPSVNMYPAPEGAPLRPLMAPPPPVLNYNPLITGGRHWTMLTMLPTFLPWFSLAGAPLSHCSDYNKDHSVSR